LLFSLQLVAGFHKSPEDQQDHAADSEIEKVKHLSSLRFN